MMFKFMSRGKWFKNREKKVIVSDKMIEKEIDPKILEIQKQIELLAENVLEAHKDLEVEVIVKPKRKNNE